MATDPGYHDEVMARLAPFGNVVSKKMFGGHGLYDNGAIFAIITSENELFFKEGDATRPLMDAAGSGPFSMGKMPYRAVPGEVFEDPDQLQVWTEAAIEVGRATVSKKKPRKKKP